MAAGDDNVVRVTHKARTSLAVPEIPAASGTASDNWVTAHNVMSTLMARGRARYLSVIRGNTEM
jgi:hypothetical protein